MASDIPSIPRALADGYQWLTRALEPISASGYAIGRWSMWVSSAGSISVDVIRYSLDEQPVSGTLYIPNACFHTESNNPDRESVERERRELEQKVADIPSPKLARRNYILSLVATIQEMAPDAELPPDWINPITELADQLKDNALTYREE